MSACLSWEEQSAGKAEQRTGDEKCCREEAGGGGGGGRKEAKKVSRQSWRGD